MSVLAKIVGFGFSFSNVQASEAQIRDLDVKIGELNQHMALLNVKLAADADSKNRQLQTRINILDLENDELPYTELPGVPVEANVGLANTAPDGRSEGDQKHKEYDTKLGNEARDAFNGCQSLCGLAKIHAATANTIRQQATLIKRAREVSDGQLKHLCKQTPRLHGNSPFAQTNEDQTFIEKRMSDWIDHFAALSDKHKGRANQSCAIFNMKIKDFLRGESQSLIDEFAAKTHMLCIVDEVEQVPSTPRLEASPVVHRITIDGSRPASPQPAVRRIEVTPQASGAMAPYGAQLTVSRPASARPMSQHATTPWQVGAIVPPSANVRWSTPQPVPRLAATPYGPQGYGHAGSVAQPQRDARIAHHHNLHSLQG